MGVTHEEMTEEYINKVSLRKMVTAEDGVSVVEIWKVWKCVLRFHQRRENYHCFVSATLLGLFPSVHQNAN